MSNLSISKNRSRQYSWWRRLQLDLRVFTYLFPWHIAALFITAFLLLAFVFQRTYLHAYQVEAEAFSFIKALYAILNMATFQITFTDIPPGPELDSFFIIVPLISTPLLLMFGANLIQILRVFFVRQERGQIWQQALAKTTPNPLVICGLGRVGYRIATQLYEAGYPVIGIEAICTPLVDTLIEKDMPVILGDIRNVDVLRQAAVHRAKQVLVCTHDDLTNIMAVNYIRDMNPDAEIILRLFDDDFADEIKKTFRIKATISRSAVAAQAFAYAALGLEVLETFNVNEITYVLAEIPIRKINFDVKTLADITQDAAMTVVCLYRHDHFIIEPLLDTSLHQDDILIVFTELSYLTSLFTFMHRPQSHIIVCGIGHTGFRVVLALLALGQKVYALEFRPNDLAERLKTLGVQVGYGDYRKKSYLIEAQIEQANAIITCAEDDMINVETVIRARDLVPSIRIIARIFEEAWGHRLQQLFDIEAVYSTSELAAPEFVAAAVNLHLTQSVNLGNDTFVLARLKIHSHGSLKNMSIKQLDRLANTTVLLHLRKDAIHIPPQADALLQEDDEIVVLTSREELHAISH
jgi:voltage-gated potassium channel